MKILKNQVLATRKKATIYAGLRKQLQAMEDAALRIGAQPYTISGKDSHFLTLFNRFKAALSADPHYPAVSRYLSSTELFTQADTLKKDIARHIAKLSPALDNDSAFNAWLDELTTLRAARVQYLQEAKRLRESVPADVAAILQSNHARRAPGAGRPVGGALKPTDWLPRMEPYRDDLHYDPDTGDLTYKGRTQRDRVTPARIPRGVVIAALMGYTARAAQTDPTSWSWNTLRLVDRPAGQPNVDTVDLIADTNVGRLSGETDRLSADSCNLA